MVVLVKLQVGTTAEEMLGVPCTHISAYKISGLISSFTSRAHAVSISRGIIDTNYKYNGVNDIID